MSELEKGIRLWAQVLNKRVPLPSLLTSLVPRHCIITSSMNAISFQLVWVLYVDMVCLDYDGNVIDACMIAMIAALKNCKYHCFPVQQNICISF